MNIKEETRTEVVDGKKRKYKWYSCQVYIGKDKDGKKIYKRFSGRDKLEIMRQIGAAEVEHAEDERQACTLGAALDRYIDNRRAICSPATIKGYLTARNQYMPELMSMQISDINQDIIQHALNEFAKKHSPKTCRNAHGLISAVLKINKPELTLRTSLPQPEENDIYVPDEQEVLNIMGELTGHKLELPFLLATQCGLRESEIAALTIKNIDTDYLYVKEARVAGPEGQAYKAPKSRKGYRSVPISQDLYLFLQSSAGEDGHITQLTGQQISKAWTTFRDKQGIAKALNFHALRHHYASKCLLMGLPQKYIADLMGHASTDMIERVYQHIFPSAMEKFAEDIRQKMISPNAQQTTARTTETA